MFSLRLKIPPKIRTPEETPDADERKERFLKAGKTGKMDEGDEETSSEAGERREIFLKAGNAGKEDGGGGGERMESFLKDGKLGKEGGSSEESVNEHVEDGTGQKKAEEGVGVNRKGEKKIRLKQTGMMTFLMAGKNIAAENLKTGKVEPSKQQQKDKNQVKIGLEENKSDKEVKTEVKRVKNELKPSRNIKNIEQGKEEVKGHTIKDVQACREASDEVKKVKSESIENKSDKKEVIKADKSTNEVKKVKTVEETDKIDKNQDKSKQVIALKVKNDDGKRIKKGKGKSDKNQGKNIPKITLYFNKTSEMTVPKNTESEKVELADVEKRDSNLSQVDAYSQVPAGHDAWSSSSQGLLDTVALMPGSESHDTPHNITEQ